MSLPTSELLQPEIQPSPPAHHRRRRRFVIPGEINERTVFIQELAQRLFPSIDFFLLSILASLVLAAALLMDSPALFVLAALLAPFMAPVLGLSLSTVVSSTRYFLQAAVTLLISGLMVFAGGLLAGWATRFFPEITFQQAHLHTGFSWADFTVLALGAGLSTYLLVRSPKQKPLVTSAALAYELLLPLGAAGYGLVIGSTELWPGGLAVYGAHLVWAALIGALVLGILRLRPLRWFGYFLGAVFFLTSLAAAFAISGLALPSLPPPSQLAVENTLPSVSPVNPTRTPTPTQTITSSGAAPAPTTTRTPTNTLIPTNTPTSTVSPMPTPVWARVNSPEGGGVYLRKEASFNAAVVQTLMNGTLIQVLPEVVQSEGVNWAHVHTTDGKEGWVVRNLLMTATPAPGW